MRILHRLALCALLVLAARPAAAQGIGIEGVPWGGAPGVVAQALETGGMARVDDETAQPGDLVFMNAEQTLTLTAYFADGRLVGLSTIVSVDPGTSRAAFGSMRAGFEERYGTPASEGADYVEWQDGDTALSISLGQDDGGEYVYLLHSGPGYTQEYRRRQLAAGTLYPALEPRWTVISASVESRVAFDRTTLAAPGALRRAWVRVDYADVQPSPAEHNASMNQLEVDCGQRRLRFLTAVYRMDNQEVDRQGPGETGGWIDAEPESTGEAAVTAICAADRP